VAKDTSIKRKKGASIILAARRKKGYIQENACSHPTEQSITTNSYKKKNVELTV
jgi:hypothetical protein